MRHPVVYRRVSPRSFAIRATCLECFWNTVHTSETTAKARGRQHTEESNMPETTETTWDTDEVERWVNNVEPLYRWVISYATSVVYNLSPRKEHVLNETAEKLQELTEKFAGRRDVTEGAQPALRDLAAAVDLDKVDWHTAVESLVDDVLSGEL